MIVGLPAVVGCDGRIEWTGIAPVNSGAVADGAAADGATVYQCRREWLCRRRSCLPAQCHSTLFNGKARQLVGSGQEQKGQLVAKRTRMSFQSEPFGANGSLLGEAGGGPGDWCMRALMH